MTARRARVADYHKLRSKQNYYNEGRITADRYLDAVARFVAAVATEHQCLATYNIMMAALAECKGTLLTHGRYHRGPAPEADRREASRRPGEG